MNISRTLILITFCFIVISNCTLIRYKKKVKNTSIGNVDFTQIPDGKYEGYYNAYLVDARVKVNMENGRLLNIELLEHKHGKGYSGEKIIDKIVQKQSLQVDAISGATGSSKAILKAVETAVKRN